MGRWLSLFSSVVLWLTTFTSCNGDVGMYPQPLEAHSVNHPGYPLTEQSQSGFRMEQYGPASKTWPVNQQGLLHTSAARAPAQLSSLPSPSFDSNESLVKNANFTLNKIVETLSDIVDQEEEPAQSRASAGRDYDYPPHSPYGYSRPPSYYPARPNYGAYAPQPPPPYHESAYSAPLAPVHHSSPTRFSLFKTDGIVKPLATKVAGKVSGLLGLVLSLLTGSAPDDLELKGLLSVVVNGIVKPLLIAKGGLKSLISKLTIPVIALLLINLEVLITAWWLWEECPEPTYHAPPPAYSYPTYPKPAYHYNSYR